MFRKKYTVNCNDLLIDCLTPSEHYISFFHNENKLTGEGYFYA
jgi:hypothetical protein